MRKYSLLLAVVLAICSGFSLYYISYSSISDIGSKVKKQTKKVEGIDSTKFCKKDRLIQPIR